MSKMSSPILHFIIFLIIMEFAICCCGKNTTFGCKAGERKALLKFRASFTDPFNRLSSWRSTIDCCSWQGVGCDKITGHIVKLDLKNVEANLYNSSSGNRLPSNQLDSSLLELKYLSYLDLSLNDFQLSPIPAFLGSMKQLQYLNLSISNFRGVVPHQLGNLSSLHTLDLSSWPPGILKVDDLMWVSNLPSLEQLGMSGVNLSQTKDLVQVLNMLPSIVVLRLSYSGLDNSHLPHAYVNSSVPANIQELDLSWNSFDGEFPCFLHNMTSLRVLDLSYNRYNSSDSHLLRLRNLVHLKLDGNSLHYGADWISEFLSDKCQLESLNLVGNQFYGEISGLFKNLSGCWTPKLKRLDLGFNKFHGQLPEELGELKQLNYLDLSNNKLSGPIPTTLGKLTALRVLRLLSNQLSGKIPISLGQLSNLDTIFLNFNSFNDTLSDAHLARLSKLKILRLEHNSISFGMESDWVPPFQLEELNMASCKIEGELPQWFQTQKALMSLRMPNCKISGTLPKWFYFVNLTELDLSDNHINGSIPDSLCEMTLLRSLDLSKNHLSGNLPDCWPNLQKLEVIRLSSNGFSGFISNSIGGAYSLNWLHLNNNSFIGQLPSTLRNCTRLIALDVGDNKLTGKLPEWIGKYLQGMSFLILRNNEFHGTIPFAFCQLSKLQVMDLADNKLIGKLPPCIGNFIGMIKGHSNNIFLDFDWYYLWFHQVMKGVEREYTTNAMFVVNLDLSNNNLDGEIPSELTNLSALIGLNLSHNQLGGKIPEKFGGLESLESLDLSSNNLLGKIPDSLSDLNSLSHLNLSHNNLSGQIPTGNQLQTLNDPSIYDGNPELCGAPLLKKCQDDRETKSPNVENQGEADGGDKAEKIYFCGVVISGFATGFWGVIGVLVFRRSWRQAYFQFIEKVICKILRS